MGGSAKSSSETTNVTTTTTSNIADSFNQTLSDIKNFSNAGNVSVGSGDSPTQLIIILGALVALGALAFYFLKGK